MNEYSIVMPTDAPKELNYSVTPLSESTCQLDVGGVITTESANTLLARVWEDAEYARHRCAMWDVSACELPDFNVLLRIAQFIAREKRGRGPTVVAFVSPDFASSALLRAFRGFENILKFKVNFFADRQNALDWIEVRESD